MQLWRAGVCRPLHCSCTPWTELSLQVGFRAAAALPGGKAASSLDRAGGSARPARARCGEQATAGLRGHQLSSHWCDLRLSRNNLACFAAAFHPPCRCAWLRGPQLANNKVQSCQRGPWWRLSWGLAAARAGAVHAHPGVRCGRCAHMYFAEIIAGGLDAVSCVGRAAGVTCGARAAAAQPGARCWRAVDRTDCMPVQRAWTCGGGAVLQGVVLRDWEIMGGPGLQCRARYAQRVLWWSIDRRRIPHSASMCAAAARHEHLAPTT